MATDKELAKRLRQWLQNANMTEPFMQDVAAAANMLDGTAAEQVRASEWPKFPESCHPAEYATAASDKCLLLYFETEEVRNEFAEWLTREAQKRS